jgi:hypothetical protein
MPLSWPLSRRLRRAARAGIPFSPEGWTWDQIVEMAPRLSGKREEGGTDYCMLPKPEGASVLGLISLLKNSQAVRYSLFQQAVSTYEKDASFLSQHIGI